MECPETMQVLVSAWCDGETDARESATVEEHLASCESCRALAETWTRDQARFRALFACAAAEPRRRSAPPRSVPAFPVRGPRVLPPVKRSVYLLVGIAGGLAVGLAVGLPQALGTRSLVGRVVASEGPAVLIPGYGAPRALTAGDRVRSAPNVRSAGIDEGEPDTLRTEDGATLRLALDGGGEVTLGGNSHLTLLGAHASRLEEGSAAFAMPEGARPFDVQVPGGVIRALRGGVSIARDEGSVRVALTDGELEMRSSGTSVRLIAFPGKPREVRIGADGGLVFPPAARR